MRKHGQRGMTLLELLVVVAIIGILSAVAIWNYFIAINRAKQKRTMANIRTVALSWELYAQDTESYVPSGAVFEFPENAVSLEDMENALLPKYMKSFPRADGWSNDLDLGYDEGPPSTYAIRSRGADGEIDESYDTQFTEKFDNDIIFSNGLFVVSPKNK